MIRLLQSSKDWLCTVCDLVSPTSCATYLFCLHVPGNIVPLLRSMVDLISFAAVSMTFCVCRCLGLPSLSRSLAYDIGIEHVNVEVDGEPDDKDRQGLGSYCCARSSCMTFSEERSSRNGILTSDGGSLPVGEFSQISKR